MVQWGTGWGGHQSRLEVLTEMALPSGWPQLLPLEGHATSTVQHAGSDSTESTRRQKAEHLPWTHVHARHGTPTRRGSDLREFHRFSIQSLPALPLPQVPVSGKVAG